MGGEQPANVRSERHNCSGDVARLFPMAEGLYPFVNGLCQRFFQPWHCVYIVGSSNRTVSRRKTIVSVPQRR